MSSPLVQFFSEDIHYTPAHKQGLRNWIRRSVKHEGKKLRGLNFIFCSDAHLLSINKQYLQHSSYTDIITFDTGEEHGFIQGDIFISIERVRDNAVKYQVSEAEELHRVIIHGVLHLCGYSDKTDPHKKIMRRKENEYLKLREFTASEHQ